jgi:TatD DNase family protein
VAVVPFERLLVETDSPYLAPVPHRGRRNRPAWVTDVGARVAELRDVPVAEVRDHSAAAARAAFPALAEAEALTNERTTRLAKRSWSS